MAEEMFHRGHVPDLENPVICNDSGPTPNWIQVVGLNRKEGGIEFRDQQYLRVQSLSPELREKVSEELKHNVSDFVDFIPNDPEGNEVDTSDIHMEIVTIRC